MKTSTIQTKAVLLVITALFFATYSLIAAEPVKKVTPTFRDVVVDSLFSNKSVDEINSLYAGISKNESSEINFVVDYTKAKVAVNVQKTYFIPGAGFDHKGDRAQVNFANVLIDTCSKTFGDDFVLIKNSSKRIPIKPLRAGLNGKWAIMNGYKQVNYKWHPNVHRTVKEIEEDYSKNPNNLYLNIIGSSYGSVVAAQTALAILERDNEIDEIGVLVLSATMIHPDSELSQKLKAYEQEGRIHEILFHYNPDDNISGVSGKSKTDAAHGLEAVVFRAPISIMDMKNHSHNIAAEDPSRAYELFEKIIVESPVKWFQKIKEHKN